MGKILALPHCVLELTLVSDECRFPHVLPENGAPLPVNVGPFGARGPPRPRAMHAMNGYPASIDEKLASMSLRDVSHLFSALISMSSSSVRTRAQQHASNTGQASRTMALFRTSVSRNRYPGSVFPMLTNFRYCPAWPPRRIRRPTVLHTSTAMALPRLPRCYKHLRAYAKKKLPRPQYVCPYRTYCVSSCCHRHPTRLLRNPLLP